jgi:hypothetical protein
MSTTNIGSKQASGLLKTFVERHTLPIFFVLVFALTWPLEIIDALGSHGYTKHPSYLSQGLSHPCHSSSTRLSLRKAFEECS